MYITNLPGSFPTASIPAAIPRFTTEGEYDMFLCYWPGPAVLNAGDRPLAQGDRAAS